MRRRDVVVALGGMTLGGCASVVISRADYDAVLSRDKTSLGSVPAYPTLTAALAAAPTGEAPYRIFIPAGVWREHNRVTRPNVRLIGASRHSSVLVFDDVANVPRSEGAPGSTLVVEAPDFQATHLTIDNDFDYPHNMPADVPYDRTGASGAQARAVQLNAAADRCVFDDCAITGWQDTLFVDVGRSLFRRCYVSGCVDFIYGAGVAVFDHCEIRMRTRPGKDFHGFIAAPSTDRRQRFGLIFLDCTLTKDRDMPAHTATLGRPWRRTGTFPDGRYGNPDAVGHAAYVRCWMDDHIVSEGWYPMHYNNKEGVRTMLQPEEARLFEFASTGPGAGVGSVRRRQLTAAEAREYRLETILGDWRPVSRSS